MTETYNWTYASIGGITRIKISSGEDIAHLGELDQKKWTVLSCPAAGLEIDQKTLSFIDKDGDGMIHVVEVVATAEWLTSIIKDKDLILKGDCALPLSQINTENPEGQKLYNSAKQILANLGLEKDEISIADTSDSVAIFAKTQFNGDGIITTASTDDAELQKIITDAVSSMGGVMDRSGVEGVNADKIEAFYTACADYAAWQDAAEADKEAIFPYRENTEAALAACTAIKDKVADYFMRCKLISFDEAVAGTVDVSVDKVGAIADKDLSACADEIATYPLARPSKDQVLDFNAINPAWQAAVESAKSLAIGSECQDSMTEAQWQAILGKFSAYQAWKGAKKGAEVEALGLETVKQVLASDKKAALLELVAQDASLKEESESIDAVDKLMHLYRDFARFLRNFVVFEEFYNRKGEPNAIFEAGKLYIDERCCNLCIKVAGSGNHAEAAGLSGMFLIYCTCTSKKLGKTMNIVAAMTDGSIKNIRPGKNGVFYDLQGNDWDAVITKVVDNPISIKQAFWSPYRKLAAFINDKIDKSAAEKDSKATADLLAKADKPADGTAKQPFDIGKFVGIFAAVGMAFAGIGVALKSLVSGIVALKWWQLLLVIAAIMLIISGPACFIAWKKLRKRNLGPILNANGWAINSSILINILFGGTLTNVAKYPVMKLDDPYMKKSSPWKKWLCGIVIAAAACAALYFTDSLKCIGLPFHKAQTEQCEGCCEQGCCSEEGCADEACCEAAAEGEAE